LIEHYAGNFPLWLAPDQVRVITLNDDEALINYAKPIVNHLRANMVRMDSDYSATPLKAKIPTRNNCAATMLVTRPRYASARQASAVAIAISAISKSIGIQIQRPPAFKPGTMIRLPDMITNGAEIRHESAFEPLDNAELRKVKSGSSMILNVLRHSTAMNLLQHCVDRSVIAMWLGHESMDTTQIYLHADIELKEKALAKTEPFRVRSGRYRPSDQLLAFLQAL